ncbi:MAG: hypothetical protein ACK5MA_02360 [Parachlamydiaceae bacterium]
MEITVENTYNLFFKYFSNAQDDTKTKAAKLCASIAIGVFTLGIYHLTIGLWHRHNLKKTTEGATQELSQSIASLSRQTLSKTRSSESSASKSATASSEKSDSTTVPPTPATPSHRSMASQSDAVPPAPPAQAPSSSSSSSSKSVEDEEKQKSSESAQEESEKELSESSQEELPKEIPTDTRPLQEPQQTNAETVQRFLAENKKDDPQLALQSWKKQLTDCKEGNSPASRFQLVKWAQEGKNIGQTYTEAEVEKILQAAANANIPEARYQYCLRKQGEQDRQYIRHSRALEKMNTPEAQYYSYLLSPTKSFAAFNALKEVLLKSDCEAGLYNLYCPKKLSQFSLYRDNSGAAQALTQAVSKGHSRACFEKGRILRGEFGQAVQEQMLSHADLALSPEERALKGLYLIASAAFKGHNEAIDAMIAYYPEGSDKRIAWEQMNQKLSECDLEDLVEILPVQERVMPREEVLQAALRRLENPPVISYPEEPVATPPVEAPKSPKTNLAFALDAPKQVSYPEEPMVTPPVEEPKAPKTNLAFALDAPKQVSFPEEPVATPPVQAPAPRRTNLAFALNRLVKSPEQPASPSEEQKQDKPSDPSLS